MNTGIPASSRGKQLALLLLLLLLPTAAARAAELPRYAVAVTAAPVLNTADFSSVFPGRENSNRQPDQCGQLRTVEFVALPGTVFTILGEEQVGGSTVYRVSTTDYPYPAARGYYVHGRSVRLEKDKPPERLRRLPERAEIIAALKRRTGTAYVWGGNLAEGVVDPGGVSDQRQLAGLDCSGLLYEATGGYTPRNTSALVNYGRGLAIAGKNAAAIAASLQPLDLLVWPGHLLIVIDQGNIMESRLVCANPAEGVRIRPLAVALGEIMKTRRPVNSIGKGAGEFVIRRWFGISDGR